MNRITFILPCYNCGDYIAKNYEILKSEIKKCKVVYEIIFIDDGSKDNTFDILKNLKKKNKYIKIFKNKKNSGKSFSVIKAINKSRYNKIVLIDCDLPYLSSLKKIIFYLKNNVNLVIVNRKLKNSNMVNRNLNFYQLLRYFIGNLVAFINLKLLKIKIVGGDTQAGLKGFIKVKNFNKIKFISRKFFFDLELVYLYSILELKIVSVKCNYNVPSQSSIKIFDVKNLLILKELFNIILNYKKNFKLIYTQNKHKKKNF